MIAIDFQGGAHGNFLEFVCNKAAGVGVLGSPFNAAGASHNKQYLTPRVFYADHYSFDPVPLQYNRVIAVKIEVDDLLPLSQISLLRAGDYGYDNDELEVDTYHKLNNVHYRWVLDNLISKFFEGQVSRSFDAVCDPSWPEVTTVNEFKQLPLHIQQECLDVHNLELLELSDMAPDCPRHILGEFFEIGFVDLQNHGFMTQQQRMQYQDRDVYVFPFASFYNTEQFVQQIDAITKWANLVAIDISDIVQLHKEFLTRQPYAHSKQKCDQIVQQCVACNNFDLPKVTLIEESYINAQLTRQGYERRYRYRRT
jgi:hypothetical protein